MLRKVSQRIRSFHTAWTRAEDSSSEEEPDTAKVSKSRDTTVQRQRGKTLLYNDDNETHRDGKSCGEAEVSSTRGETPFTLHSSDSLAVPVAHIRQCPPRQDAAIQTDEENRLDAAIQTNQEDRYDAAIQTNQEDRYDAAMQTDQEDRYDAAIQTNKEDRYDAAIQTNQENTCSSCTQPLCRHDAAIQTDQKNRHNTAIQTDQEIICNSCSHSPRQDAAIQTDHETFLRVNVSTNCTSEFSFCQHTQQPSQEVEALRLSQVSATTRASFQSDICLYNQEGELCTVQGRRYVFTQVGGAPLLVSVDDPEEHEGTYGLLWKSPTLPSLISQVPDGTQIFLDAIGATDSLKLTAALLWLDKKPSQFCIPADKTSQYFLGSILVTGAKLVSSRKKTGVMSVVIANKEIKVDFSYNYTFLDQENVTENNVAKLFSPTSSVNVILYEFLHITTKSTNYTPVCIWKNRLPCQISTLTPGRLYSWTIGTNFGEKKGHSVRVDVLCDLFNTATKTELVPLDGSRRIDLGGRASFRKKLGRLCFAEPRVRVRAHLLTKAAKGTKDHETEVIMLHQVPEADNNQDTTVALNVDTNEESGEATQAEIILTTADKLETGQTSEAGRDFATNYSPGKDETNKSKVNHTTDAFSGTSETKMGHTTHDFSGTDETKMNHTVDDFPGTSESKLNRATHDFSETNETPRAKVNHAPYDFLGVNSENSFIMTSQTHRVLPASEISEKDQMPKQDNISEIYDIKNTLERYETHPLNETKKIDNITEVGKTTDMHTNASTESNQEAKLQKHKANTGQTVAVPSSPGRVLDAGSSDSSLPSNNSIRAIPKSSSATLQGHQWSVGIPVPKGLRDSEVKLAKNCREQYSKSSAAAQGTTQIKNVSVQVYNKTNPKYSQDKENKLQKIQQKCKDNPNTAIKHKNKDIIYIGASHWKTHGPHIGIAAAGSRILLFNKSKLYIDQKKCSVSEFGSRPDVFVNAMAIPLEHPRQVLGFTATHEAVVAWQGKKPPEADAIVSEKQYHMKQSVAKTTATSKLDGPLEPSIDRKNVPRAALKDITGKLIKITNKYGILSFTHYQVGTAKALFYSNITYVEQTRLNSKISLQQQIKKNCPKQWHCSVKPFSSCIDGVEVQYKATIVWKGKKPAVEDKERQNQTQHETQHHSTCSEEAYFFSEKEKQARKPDGPGEGTEAGGSNGHKATTTPVPHLQLVPGVVNMVSSCLVWLSCSIGERFVARDHCYLCGVGLREVPLDQVYRPDMEVECEVNVGRVGGMGVSTVWAGGRPADPCAAYALLRQWCLRHQVPQSTLDLLMQRAGREDDGVGESSSVDEGARGDDHDQGAGGDDHDQGAGGDDHDHDTWHHHLFPTAAAADEKEMVQLTAHLPC